MKTITISLYSFKELSKEAQEKAIVNLNSINVDYEWWDFIYEDAANIGLKLLGFDLDRNRGATGEFTLSASEVAEKIISEHGKDCETHKTAKEFLSKYKEFEGMSEECAISDSVQDLEDEFLKSLLEDYSIMLQNESEHLQSDESIIETIEANDYTFEEDGTMNNG